MRKTGCEGVQRSRGKSRIHSLQKREYSLNIKIGGGRFHFIVLQYIRIHGECAVFSSIASLFPVKDAYITTTISTSFICYSFCKIEEVNRSNEILVR